MPIFADCPDRAHLQRFLLGHSDGGEAESVEQHLEHCDRCLATLNTLPTEDSLADALRVHGTIEEAPDSNTVGSLAAKLKALPSAALSGEDTVAVVPQASEGGRADAAYDFLAPPHHLGELGALGPYDVLKVLGAGGMGVVFLARDPRLDRLVALKTMLPTVAVSLYSKQRFLREARAAAAIKHDHIVTIYQVGEDCGAPFLAMELLEGESLEDRLKRERRLPVSELLRIGRETADGLAAAHKRGLIHRDIKPGNIWLEGDGGRVKILDFGLVRAAAVAAEESGTEPSKHLFDEAVIPSAPVSALTQQGSTVGTPAYMAPEQAEDRPVDARSDLFSLGCVLYRMATGELPFKGKNAISTLLAVVAETPTPPRELNPDLPAPLCDLVRRLLSKKAEDRPGSARAVVEAIQAVERPETQYRTDAQAAVPIRPAARPRPAIRAVGASRRSWLPIVAAVLLGALACAAYLLGPAVIRYASDRGELVIEIDDPNVEAVVNQSGVTIHDKAKDKSYTVKPGRRDLKAGDYELEVREVGGDMRVFTKEFTITRGATTSVLVTLEPTTPAKMKRTAKLEQPALLYSIPWLDEQQGFPANIYQTGISSDGRLFFGAGDGGPTGKIRVWNLATGRQIQELIPGGDAWYSFARFLPGSKYLIASYFTDNDLWLWDVATGKVVRKFVGHTKPLSAFAVSPDGRRILSWGNDQTMRLWDVESGAELRKLDERAEKAMGVFSPDGKQILTFSPGGTLQLWDVETGAELKNLEGHTGPCTGCFSPDGKNILSDGTDHTIRLWDAKTGKEVRRFEGATAAVVFAGFVGNGRLVVGQSDDKKLRVWERANGKLISEIDSALFGADGGNLTASPDGRLALVSVENDQSVRVLGLLTGKEIYRYNKCPKARAFTFSPNGTRAVAGSFRAGMFVFRLP